MKVPTPIEVSTELAELVAIDVRLAIKEKEYKEEAHRIHRIILSDYDPEKEGRIANLLAGGDNKPEFLGPPNGKESKMAWFLQEAKRKGAISTLPKDLR